jgi:hypothetical protein
MEKEEDPKIAAAKCFEEIGLDPDSYRIGHTKARRAIRLVCSSSHSVHGNVTFNSLKWCRSSKIPSDTAFLGYSSLIQI